MRTKEVREWFLEDPFEQDAIGSRVLGCGADVCLCPHATIATHLCHTTHVREHQKRKREHKLVERKEEKKGQEGRPKRRRT